MRNNNKNNNIAKSKCNKCGSTNLKTRKNFTHGSSSKAKTSYICNDCNSTDIDKATNKRNFRR